MNLGQLLGDARPGVLVQADWKLPGLGMPALPICFTGIGLTSFVPAEFTRQGIECPPRIQASVPKRQAEFLAGRLCVRAQLSTRGVPDATIARGALGAPGWPPGWTGSITHSCGHAASALLPSSDVVGIGIDLEVVANSVASEALGMVAVNPAEDALLSSGHGLTVAEFRTLVFSAKESFFKASAAQVGRYFDFTALQLIDVDFGNGILHFVISEALHPRLMPGAAHRAAFLRAGDVVLTASVLHR